MFAPLQGAALCRLHFERGKHVRHHYCTFIALFATRVGWSWGTLTGVERLLYGSLSAVLCLLWPLYGAVWVDKHRVIIIEHRRPSCLHLTVTDWELRLHNTVSNPHSRIEYNSPDMSSQQLRHRNVLSKQCHFSEQNSNKLSRQTFENTSSCLHVVVHSQNHKQYLRNISSIFMYRLRVRDSGRSID